MTIFQRARAEIDKLNTHKIFGVGVGTALGSFATIVAAPHVTAIIGAHPSLAGGPAGVAVVTNLIGNAVAAAWAALPPAVLAAGFSRPPNVPSGPIIASNVPISGTRGTDGTLSLAPQVAHADGDNGARQQAPTTALASTAGLQAGKEQVSTVSPTTAQVTGALADLITADFEGNKHAVVAAITSVEGGLEAAVVTKLKTTKPGGFLGAAWGFIEPNLEKYVTGLIAQYGAPAVAYAFLDKELHLWATGLGG
jgi:hypothetical protein